MTKEEQLKQEAKKSCIDKTHYCIGGSGGDAYCEGYIDSAELREKRIEELEKENAELKKNNKSYEKIIDNSSATLMKEKLKNYKQLTKAKEIINQLVKCVRFLNDPKVELTDCDDFLAEAEQFLSEVEK